MINVRKKIIHEDEVVSFLNSWKNGVINIGKKFTENDDFISEAKNFISQHYNFNESDVLFKPTFTKEIVLEIIQRMLYHILLRVIFLRITVLQSSLGKKLIY